MTENTGYAAYLMFNAIKLHFTSNYDYFQYNAKLRLTQDTFMKNNAKYSYYKLSRKYSLDEMRNIFVANFVYRDCKWIGDMLTSEGEECFRKWQKIDQSLSYRFKTDIEELIGDDPNEMLKVKDGQHPKLLTSTMSGDTAIETLVILNDIMNFFPMWKKRITDDVIWPSWERKIVKYTPFVTYDKPKFKTILKDAISEYA